MAKFYGTIGYGVKKETAPGVWQDEIVERQYYGDVTRGMSKNKPASKLNDDVTVSDEISIVADPFAYEHFSQIRYVTYMKVKWKVSNVEVRRPRLILTMGEVYNGYENGTS